MAKFNRDPEKAGHAPSVPSLAMQTAQNPNPAAPATTPSGPRPGMLESGVGFSGVQKQMYDKIDPASIGSLTKKKK